MSDIPEDDRPARARIANDLRHTFVVEAAAGTGKTTALVGRIVALVAQGLAELRTVVAVTFTEAAAGELKLRLRTALEEERGRAADPASRDLLTRALTQLEEARISTIHGFCADLLRERPVEAGVDPLFVVATEDEARALFDRAFDAWFQSALERQPEPLRRMLRRRKRGRFALGPEGTLREAAHALLEHRDYPAAWRRDPWDRAAELDRLLPRLRECAALEAQADDRSDYLRQSLAPVAAFVRELDRREAQRAEARAERDDDGLEADLGNLARGEKGGRSWAWTGGRREWYARDRLRRRDVIAVRDEVKAELDAFVDRANRDLAASLHSELAPLGKEYERLLQRAGKLDFLDLLLRARTLLDDTAVRTELQGRFSHYFVDEFQDTDPLQADILCLLSADDPAEGDPLSARPVPGKLFLVGDPKQSIYRFRRADVALYAAVKQRLLERGAELLYLSKSFRAVPSIQSAINAAFSSAMTGASQATYVPLAPARKEPTAQQPSLVVLPAPRIYGDFGRDPRDYVIQASFPDAACAFVDYLVNESGFSIEERGQRVPVQPRHVCMLFRRMQVFGDDLTRAYVRGLEARQIPHVLVGGRSFHEREEVLALRQAVTAIEWPDDALAIYSTLRGPLFALPDELLFAWAGERGTNAFHLHLPKEARAATVDAELAPVAEALELLFELHRRRNRRPIADTVSELLERTRAHAGFASWVAGEQALSNVLRVVELARRFEARGATSFRAFVEWLELSAERGGAAEAPVVEDGTEGVRLLSVHKAKGLEFPVVMLVDPTAPGSPSAPSHWVDHHERRWVERIAGCVPAELRDHEVEVLAREKEEIVRLAYVAATRARDMLVVPGVGDGPYESWLTPLDPAVQPAERSDARRGPGCPPFGSDTVLVRPDHLVGATTPVAPGLHAPRSGLHGVVWWDPRTLGLEREPDLGLRQDAILHPHDDPARGEPERQGHAAFVARRALAHARGGKIALRAQSVTAMAHGDPRGDASGGGSGDGAAVSLEAGGPGAGEVKLEEVPGREGPRGKRFGTLVHAVLASAPSLAANAADLLAVARAHGRLLGAPEVEITAAATRVVAALAHPRLVRAATCEHRREVPVSLVDDAGTLLEGVIDLAFLDRDRWVIVDYKTDRSLDAALGPYVLQLRAYGRAITAATTLPTELVLLRV